jgi:hypothetical protein
VDLDEPRVGADQSNAEFSLNYNDTIASSLGRAIRLQPGRLAAGLLPGDPDRSAEPGCDRRRRSHHVFPDRPGHRDREGISQKLVVLTVNSVAKDGTVNVTVSAWDVPQ